MDHDQLRVEFLGRQMEFSRAAKNIREAVELLISEAGISVLTVASRVKDVDSFLEKCNRKSYSSPFTDNTDFVGIRVITYLPGDVTAIIEEIRKSFVIVESNDKANNLAANEFGYRSHHLLVRVPEAWTKTPNYSGLGDLTIEIQVRTILMHAWAEIEHKLQYKSADQVPRELTRRLFMLSAKVEEADGQFESLVKEVQSYRDAIADKVAKTGTFDTETDFNLDSFKAFLQYKYPNNPSDDAITQNLYAEISAIPLSLQKVADTADKFVPYEKQLKSFVDQKLSSAGILGYALEVLVPEFRKTVNGSQTRTRIVRKLIAIAELEL